MDAAREPTGMYSRRVPADPVTHPGLAQRATRPQHHEKKSTQRTTHTKRFSHTGPDTHAKALEKLIQRMTTRSKIFHLFITDHLTRHLPGTFQAINQAKRQCFLA